MGFIDELKRLARPYEDEEEDEEAFDDFEPVSRVERKEKPREATGALYAVDPEPRRSNKVVNIHTTTQLQVVLVKPDRFENAAEIADHLREKRTVVPAGFPVRRGLRQRGQDQEGGHLHL